MQLRKYYANSALIFWFKRVPNKMHVFHVWFKCVPNKMHVSSAAAQGVRGQRAAESKNSSPLVARRADGIWQIFHSRVACISCARWGRVLVRTVLYCSLCTTFYMDGCTPRCSPSLMIILMSEVMDDGCRCWIHSIQNWIQDWIQDLRGGRSRRDDECRC